MRIGHIIQSTRVKDGGTTSALMALCDSLVHAGSTCTIACRGCDPPEAAQLPVGVTQTVIDPGRWPLQNRVGIGELRRFIKSVDVLHLHGVWDAMPTVAGMLARRMGVPYVQSLHGMLLEPCFSHHRWRKQAFLATVGRRVLRGAAVIHCTTTAELRDASPLLPGGPDRVVVPLAVEAKLLQEEPYRQEWRKYFPQLPDAWPRLLFLARIHRQKNPEALLNALPALVREFPDLHVVVAGNGEEHYVRGLRALTEELGVVKNVHFIGLVGGDAKAALIRSATILAIPTFHENFGMTVAECMACGVPALVTPGLGIGEEILANDAGVECGEDSGSVGDSLARALRLPGRLRNVGDNGRRWAMRALASETVAAGFLAAYASASDRI